MLRNELISENDFCAYMLALRPIGKNDRAGLSGTKYFPEDGNRHGNMCSLLTKTGCLLGLNERPYECRFTTYLLIFYKKHCFSPFKIIFYFSHVNKDSVEWCIRKRGRGICNLPSSPFILHCLCNPLTTILSIFRSWYCNESSFHKRFYCRG